MNSRYFLLLVTALLGACAHEQALVVRPPPPELVMEIETPPTTAAEEQQEIDRMADVQGDRLLPAVGGVLEQIDCKVGTDDRQARMALEARGGQIRSFAYYSKWRPRTCSMYMQRDDGASKWRLTEDGATRVQSPHGLFLIRRQSAAYEFEFIDVERKAFCGMDGHTNGRMIIKRLASTPECSVSGLLDRADSTPVLLK